MEIGIVGLGRMGAGMARRLARGGARVVAYDQERAPRDALAEESGIEVVESLAAVAAQTAGERVILMMLPAGEPTKTTLTELLQLLSAGDTIVDGANAYYKDSMARALELSQQGLRYIDAGVSGGIHGLATGYCLMLGGTPKSIEIFEPYAKILARCVRPNQYPSGSRRLAGIASFRTCDVTGRRRPSSFARCSLPASTVISTSAGDAAPSRSRRVMSSSAVAVTTRTSIPVSSWKRSKRI